MTLLKPPYALLEEGLLRDGSYLVQVLRKGSRPICSAPCALSLRDQTLHVVCSVCSEDQLFVCSVCSAGKQLLCTLLHETCFMCSER